MSAAGVCPRGFVAPAYAYTRTLRRELDSGFDWWAGLVRVHANGSSLTAPAHGLGVSGPFKRLLSPHTAWLGTRVAPGQVLRIDVHPADFDHPRHVRALERMLRVARGRSMVTYDELVAG
jgi:predicted deacetylase